MTAKPKPDIVVASPSDETVNPDANPIVTVSPRHKVMLELLGTAADVPHLMLKPIELRHVLEADCLGTDLLIAQLQSIANGAEWFSEDVREHITVHTSECARCVDRIHMIGRYLKIPREQLDTLAPEPTCDSFNLPALLDGTQPITDEARRHLHACSPCRNALLEEYESPIAIDKECRSPKRQLTDATPSHDRRNCLPSTDKSHGASWDISQALFGSTQTKKKADWDLIQ